MHLDLSSMGSISASGLDPEDRKQRYILLSFFAVITYPIMKGSDHYVECTRY